MNSLDGIFELIFTGSCYAIKNGTISSSKIRLYFILLVFPDIADLVLTILGYSKESLAY